MHARFRPSKVTAFVAMLGDEMNRREFLDSSIPVAAA
ncbi:hypothetical protein E9232_002893 [Inquilinus ginsengisoli]|uniref:Uncharacterized protein n=1 Tax=Inquilinus ginsengisoli TaxID=363840 RepID=A0ABU1JP24_9PROT|nr:hypothetical protein [Inquilinus ginsengisoli]